VDAEITAFEDAMNRVSPYVRRGDVGPCNADWQRTLGKSGVGGGCVIPLTAITTTSSHVGFGTTSVVQAPR